MIAIAVALLLIAGGFKWFNQYWYSLPPDDTPLEWRLSQKTNESGCKQIYWRGQGSHTRWRRVRMTRTFLQTVYITWFYPDQYEAYRENFTTVGEMRYLDMEMEALYEANTPMARYRRQKAADEEEMQRRLKAFNEEWMMLRE